MAATDVSQLDGLFKDQFHSDVENLIPDHVVLQKGLIDWVPADKSNGQFYSVPTLLRSNQGVTYLGTGGSMAALNAATAAEMKEAQISGNEMVVRGQLSYAALARAATQGPKAFKKASAWLVEDLAQVAYTRIEIAALYGQDSLGVLNANPTNTSGSTWTMVITEASWAPGIWPLLEGAVLEVYDVSGSAMATSTTFTVTAVTSSTRTITATKSGSATIETSDTLHFQGARTATSTWKEMIGLYTQFTDVSSSIYNITRSSYALMQPNVYSSTGALSRAKIVEAAMLAVDKGCMSDLIVLVGTKAWAALAAEDHALRVFDSSYSAAKSQTGSKELIIESVNGNLKIVCHPFVKQSHAFIFNPDDVLWVGSSKPTFEIPGYSGEKFFRMVDGYNGVELQNFSDCSIYALKPCQTVMMTGITYS